MQVKPIVRRPLTTVILASLTAAFPMAAPSRAAIVVDGGDNQTWTSPTITHSGYFDVVAVTGATPDAEDDVAAFNVGVVVPAASLPWVRFTGVASLPAAQSGFDNATHYPTDDAFPRTDLFAAADAAGAVDLSDLPGLFRVYYQVLPDTPAGLYAVSFDADLTEFVDDDANLLSGVTFDDALITVVVPEPGTAALLAAGAGALLIRRRRVIAVA